MVDCLVLDAGGVSAGWAVALDVLSGQPSGVHRAGARGVLPRLVPDGAHTIFTDLCCQFGSNVWVMKAGGTGLKQLTHFPTKHQGGFGTYSPNGKKITLVADLKYRDNCCFDLYTMDVNGTHLTRIVTDQPGVLVSDWGTSL